MQDNNADNSQNDNMAFEDGQQKSVKEDSDN